VGAADVTRVKLSHAIVCTGRGCMVLERCDYRGRRLFSQIDVLPSGDPIGVEIPIKVVIVFTTSDADVEQEH
jgi:hypothetical protein